MNVQNERDVTQTCEVLEESRDRCTLCPESVGDVDGVLVELYNGLVEEFLCEEHLKQRLKQIERVGPEPRFSTVQEIKLALQREAERLNVSLDDFLQPKNMVTFIHESPVLRAALSLFSCDERRKTLQP